VDMEIRQLQLQQHLQRSVAAVVVHHDDAVAGATLAADPFQTTFQQILALVRQYDCVNLFHGSLPDLALLRPAKRSRVQASVTNLEFYPCPKKGPRTGSCTHLAHHSSAHSLLKKPQVSGASHASSGLQTAFSRTGTRAAISPSAIGRRIWNGFD